MSGIDENYLLHEAEEITKERYSEEQEVNHPSHYTAGGIECIDAIDSMQEGWDSQPTHWGFLAGQIMKYVWRAPLKGTFRKDLNKAKWYLDRLIDQVEDTYDKRTV